MTSPQEKARAVFWFAEYQLMFLEQWNANLEFQKYSISMKLLHVLHDKLAKLNVWCSMLHSQIISPLFFFQKKRILVAIYFNVLEIFALSKLIIFDYFLRWLCSTSLGVYTSDKYLKRPSQTGRLYLMVQYHGRIVLHAERLLTIFMQIGKKEMFMPQEFIL